VTRRPERVAPNYVVLEQKGAFPVKAWVRGVPFDAGARAQLLKAARLPFLHGWIAAMPDVQEKMQSIEFEPMSSTPEQFSEFIKTEIVRWGKVIKEADISRID